MQNKEFMCVNKPNPQAVIAGTFCLMNCVMTTGAASSAGAMYLHKIIDNFNFLSDCEALEGPLRTLCRRMACRWEAVQMQTHVSAQPEAIDHPDHWASAAIESETSGHAKPLADADVKDYAAQSLAKLH
jgi:hypothetical protein